MPLGFENFKTEIYIHFLRLKNTINAPDISSIDPMSTQKVFPLLPRGKFTFIPYKLAIKVSGSNIEEINVSAFMISLLLLVCIESKVFDKPSISSS